MGIYQFCNFLNISTNISNILYTSNYITFMRPLCNTDVYLQNPYQIKVTKSNDNLQKLLEEKNISEKDVKIFMECFKDQDYLLIPIVSIDTIEEIKYISNALLSDEILEEDCLNSINNFISIAEQAEKDGYVETIFDATPIYHYISELTADHHEILENIYISQDYEIIVMIIEFINSYLLPNAIQNNNVNDNTDNNVNDNTNE